MSKQHVRDALEKISGQMATLARCALEPPANAEVAQAWLDRAGVVSKLVESIPIIDEHTQVAALGWRLRWRH